jgi:hypothetical protein
MASRGALAPVDIQGLLAAKQQGLLPTGDMQTYQPTLRDLLAEAAAKAGKSMGLGDILAQRMRDEAAVGMDFMPGLGEAVGAEDTARAYNAGNYGEAAVSGISTGLGAIPVGGDIAGGLLKAMFLGVGAKTANHAALKTAKELAEKGADKKEIWDATGWFKGADDKWRFEIDDSASKLTPKAADELMAHDGGTRGATQRTAPGVLMHKQLYDAYPDLRSIDVDARHNVELNAPSGAFAHPSANGDRPQITIQSNSLEGEPRSVRGIMLHEMQHGVQGLEAFAPGGNPATMPTIIDLQDAYNNRVSEYMAQGLKIKEAIAKAKDDFAQFKQYRALAGEVEARNVQTRMNMTPAERRAKAPWETQDVPDELQIVRRR